MKKASKEKKPRKVQLGNAFLISFICIFTYLISYYLRHVLSYFTPQMLNDGFEKTSIALLSSTYMIVYAAGQLLNGFLGDIIRPKYMVATGLGFATVGTLLFPIADVYGLRLVCFGLLGFGLSMLRGPLVKTISENTEPGQARVACVFLSAVSFIGPFIASAFAIWMDWRTAFLISAALAAGMGIFSFALLSILERKGVIRRVAAQSDPNTPKTKRKLDILGVFRIPSFVPYLFIGMIVEISATSITFWLPTYISEYLLFPEDTAGILASVISLIRSSAPFIALLAFRLFRENDVVLIRSMFAVAVLLYAVMYFVAAPWANILIFLFALLFTGIASSTLWSIYIPSLGKSGKVSSANGVMDCTGYVAAALMNMVFAFIMETFDYRGLILSWGIVMLVGVGFTFLARHRPVEEGAPATEVIEEEQ